MANRLTHAVPLTMLRGTRSIRYCGTGGLYSGFSSPWCKSASMSPFRPAHTLRNAASLDRVYLPRQLEIEHEFDYYDVMNSGQAIPAWRLSDGELAGALLSWEQEQRQRYLVMLEMVGEAERRGLANSQGYRDTATLLAESLRIAPREARARVSNASATLGSNTTSGTTLPPALPATGAALADGDISGEHVTEIDKALSAVSGLVDDEGRQQAERQLVELAQQAHPPAVRAFGKRLMAYLDQDGTPPDEREQIDPVREFSYHYTRRGWLRFSGQLDPESAAQLEGLFGVLAKPAPAEATGEPDPRLLSQRQGDALAEVVDLATRADELSTQGGERAVMTVTVPLHQLQRRTNAALLEVPGITSVAALRRLACEAKVIPAVLGTAGEPLDVGRAARLATGAQRRALVLRDRGCAFPGCDRTPKWTTAHHIEHWADGGHTDRDNLVLLCARHHRRIHHSGWDVAIREGISEFYPPGWVDGARKPRRNRAHGSPGDPPLVTGERQTTLAA